MAIQMGNTAMVDTNNSKNTKRKYKLVAFDVDGTLIQGITSIWQTIHDYVGTSKDFRKKQWDNYHNGTISYAKWAQMDINYWKKLGVRIKDMIKSFSKVKLMNGAKKTIQELRKRKITLAIISGSFNIALEKVIPNSNKIFKYQLLSKIYFNKNGTIKSFVATPYDYEHKLTGLKQICKKEGISLKEAVFIGDNTNDVHIAKEAGLSIAFCPNSKEIEKASDIVIKKRDLSVILKYVI